MLKSHPTSQWLGMSFHFPSPYTRKQNSASALDQFRHSREVELLRSMLFTLYDCPDCEIDVLRPRVNCCPKSASVLILPQWTPHTCDHRHRRSSVRITFPHKLKQSEEIFTQVWSWPASMTSSVVLPPIILPCRAQVLALALGVFSQRSSGNVLLRSEDGSESAENHQAGMYV